MHVPLCSCFRVAVNVFRESLEMSYCSRLDCWQKEYCSLHQTWEYNNQSDESEGDEEVTLNHDIAFKLF